jgi:hypothetical protein
MTSSFTQFERWHPVSASPILTLCGKKINEDEKGAASLATAPK